MPSTSMRPHHVLPRRMGLVKKIYKCVPQRPAEVTERSGPYMQS